MTWPRIQLVVFALLWLVPVSYIVVSHKAIPFLPRTLNRLAWLESDSRERPKSWDSIYLEGQSGLYSTAWVPLNPLDFSSLSTSSGARSRLMQMIADSERQRGGDNIRRSAAIFIGEQYRLKYPQAPALTSVRFSAVSHRVGTPALAAPNGVWSDPPVGLMAMGKNAPRVLGIYPVGKAALKVSPFIYHAPPELDDAALIELVGKSEAVDFDLSGSKVTGTGLAILEKHSRLRALRVRDMQVNDSHLAWLDKMPELRSLDLTGTQITDAFLPMLNKLGQLNELRLARTNITAKAAPVVAALHELAVLDVSETELAPMTLMQLGTWPKLRTLVIERLDLDKVGKVAAAPHGRLMGVDMSGAIVGKSGLHLLRLFPMVQTLDLEGAKMVDSDLGPLSFLNNLQSVTLSGTGVTEKGVRALMASSPRIKNIRWGREGEKVSAAPKKKQPSANLASQPKPAIPVTSAQPKLGTTPRIVVPKKFQRTAQPSTAGKPVPVTPPAATQPQVAPPEVKPSSIAPPVAAPTPAESKPAALPPAPPKP